MPARKGYRPKRVVYRLEDPPGHDGLWVEAYSMTLGEMLTEKTDLALARLLGERYLKAWNLLDDDGQPVPATIDGMRSLDLHLVETIVTAWVQAVMGVADPLATSSSSGETSPEASIPMEPLSGSQAS